MKKGFLVAAFILSAAGLSISNAATGIAQFRIAAIVSAHAHDTPPPAVLNSFHAISGNIPVSEWKARSHNQWRALFNKNGTPWDAMFNNAGALVKSEPT